MATSDELLQRQIDVGALVDGIKAMQAHRKPGDITRIYGVIDQLRELPFPESYLDGVRDELVAVLGGKMPKMGGYGTHVYLAFYGMGGRASFLKIGVARNVKSRLAGHATGNPLPNLWTYTATFPYRRDATAIEAHLLRHMVADKAHGEWLHVHGLSEEATRAVVDSLAEAASQVRGEAVEFERFGG